MFYDFDILWQHIVQLYQDELGNGLKISSKLTHDHIYPTQLSVMTVKYVVLVLRKIMSVALSMFITPESTGTAKYRKIINSFLDCLCVCSLTKWRRKIKLFL